MSVSVGIEKVDKILKGNNTEIKVTNMAKAVINALNKVSETKNIILLTPYIDDLHQKTINFLSDHKFNVVKDYNFGLETDSIISSVNPMYIKNYILNLQNIKGDTIN